MSDSKLGVLPASVTPFTESGELDLPGLAKLIGWFRSHEVAGIVLAGTNGEGPSLSAVEKRDMVKSAVPLADGIPVILGVTTPSLEEAVWSCESARKAGASAALVMPPAYFREATDEGIANWYEVLFQRSTLPVIAYNFPQRSGFTFSPELISRLCKHENFAGLKDSSGNADNLLSYRQAAGSKSLYVGAEALLIQALESGWQGTISGAANVLPNWLVQIAKQWETDAESARVKHTLLLEPLKALRSAQQPMANRAVLKRLGVLDSAKPRLPLLPLDEEQCLTLWQALKGFVH